MLNFACAESRLAVSALEFPHETDQRRHGSEGNRIVKRDAHPTHRSVPAYPGKARHRGLFSELFLDFFVTVSHPEHYVHARARFLRDRGGIKAAGINRVVKQSSLLFVALLGSRDATLRRQD